MLEEELDYNYFLLLENAAGEAITYDQRLPEDVSIRVDSEHSENTTETINGVEMVVSRAKEGITLVCNDGTYIYLIQGNTDEGLLRNMMMSVIE